MPGALGTAHAPGGWGGKTLPPSTPKAWKYGMPTFRALKSFSLHPLRRQRPVEGRDSRRQPGHLPGAQIPLFLPGPVPEGDYVLPWASVTSNVRQGRHRGGLRRYGLARHAGGQLLADEGLSVEVVDVRTISPLDEDTIAAPRARQAAWLLWPKPAAPMGRPGVGHGGDGTGLRLFASAHRTCHRAQHAIPLPTASKKVSGLRQMRC